MSVSILVKQFALVIKRELNAWREGLSYIEIESFVGCCLADLRANNLLTEDEEKWLRSYLVE